MKRFVINKNVTAEKGFALAPKKTIVNWGAARKMRVEWGMARLIDVAVAKAELNNSVHLCSNQTLLMCTCCTPVQLYTCTT